MCDINENDHSVFVNYANINRYLHDVHPYIFVDEAEVIPGKCAKGFKNISLTDWYFPFHFPNNPIMPGVFQIEAIMQAAALCIATIEEYTGFVIYMNQLDDVKVWQSVRPGMKLEIEAHIDSYRHGIIKGHGTTFVQGRKMAAAKVGLLLPDVIERYKKKSVE